MGNQASKLWYSPDSRGSPASPVSKSSNHASGRAPSATPSELYLQLAEYRATIQRLETALAASEAAQRRDADIQNWLLQQLTQQHRLNQAPERGDSVKAHELAALNQRIEHLENRLDVPQQIQDLWNFGEEGPVQGLETLTPSRTLHISTSEPINGVDGGGVEVAPQVVSGPGTPAPERPDLERPVVSIPPHIRNRPTSTTAATHADRRANVSLGRSPAPRFGIPQRELTAPTSTPTPYPLDQPDVGVHRHNAYARQSPPQNAPSAPRYHGKGRYFDYSPPAPGTVFRSEDIQYVPSPDALDTRRGVLILGIPPSLHLRAILPKVTTGPLLAATMADTTSTCGYHTAHLTFLSAGAALALAQAAPMTIHGHRLTVALINTPTWPIPAAVQQGVAQHAASRFVTVAPLPDEVLTRAKLEFELRQLTGVWQASPALQYWQEGGVLTMEFACIRDAREAREHFARGLARYECRVEFGPDVWVQEAREAEEGWERVEGGGEGDEGVEKELGDGEGEGKMELLINI